MRRSFLAYAAMLLASAYVALAPAAAQAGFVVTEGNDQPIKIVATDKGMAVCDGDAIGSACLVAPTGGELLTAKILSYDNKGKPSFQIQKGMTTKEIDGALTASMYGCSEAPQRANWFKGQEASQKVFQAAYKNFYRAEKAMEARGRQTTPQP
jgi:hypothetical protein